MRSCYWLVYADVISSLSKLIYVEFTVLWLFNDGLFMKTYWFSCIIESLNFFSYYLRVARYIALCRRGFQYLHKTQRINLPWSVTDRKKRLAIIVFALIWLRWLRYKETIRLVIGNNIIRFVCLTWKYRIHGYCRWLGKSSSFEAKIQSGILSITTYNNAWPKLVFFSSPKSPISKRT